MSSLSEKQDYYRWPSSGWKYKIPPTLPHDVEMAMEREGLNSDYRFIWLGVDVIRQFELDMNPVVRGDMRACRYQIRRISFEKEGQLLVPQLVSWLAPKKAFVHARQLQKVYYLDDDGHKVTVARPELVPSRKITQFEWEFHHLGALEWRIEERTGAGSRVDLRAIFPGATSDQWYSIGTIRSKGGLYQEPSMLHVEDLLKRRWENRNLSQKEIAEVAQAENAQRETDRAWDERIQADSDRAELEGVGADIIDTVVARASHSVEVSGYKDETGATHTLWEDESGGHAQIDFTIPNQPITNGG